MPSAECLCFSRSLFSRCCCSLPCCFYEKGLSEEKFPTDRNPADTVKKNETSILISEMCHVHPKLGIQPLLRCLENSKPDFCVHFTSHPCKGVDLKSGAGVLPCRRRAEEGFPSTSSDALGPSGMFCCATLFSTSELLCSCNLGVPCI